jgi:hypothetical protein
MAMALPVRNEDHWLWIGGPVPRRAQGITLGSLVIVRAEVVGSSSFNELLRHERVHVQQFRDQGTLRFLAKYFGSYLWSRLHGYGHDAAYRRIPFEIEARWHARVPSPESTAHAQSLPSRP